MKAGYIVTVLAALVITAKLLSSKYKDYEQLEYCRKMSHFHGKVGVVVDGFYKNYDLNYAKAKSLIVYDGYKYVEFPEGDELYGVSNFSSMNGEVPGFGKFFRMEIGKLGDPGCQYLEKKPDDPVHFELLEEGYPWNSCLSVKRVVQPSAKFRVVFSKENKKDWKGGDYAIHHYQVIQSTNGLVIASTNQVLWGAVNRFYGPNSCPSVGQFDSFGKVLTAPKRSYNFLVRHKSVSMPSEGFRISSLKQVERNWFKGASPFRSVYGGGGFILTPSLILE